LAGSRLIEGDITDDTLEEVVPFVDLGPANRAVAERVLERLRETIDRGDFTDGTAVTEFEQRFAAACGTQHCVGFSSGLDALRASLIGSGLVHGAGVIVPASTFAATFEAVIQAGGTPIVVDVSEVDSTIDVDAVASSAPDASHVIPVHLYGQMADMRKLTRIASDGNLTVVEDACQAHGARRAGVDAGRGADAAAFSFYPTKPLGAIGDAGALVTDDPELAIRAHALRTHGETQKYHHEYVGYTARLDTVQAIALVEKLPLLRTWNRERAIAAQYYAEALSACEGVRLPELAPESEPAWHLYVVRVPNPERFMGFLADHGIKTARHYPVPLHLAPAYRSLGYAPGDFPIAESLAREAVSLPLFAGITESQLERVCDAVRAYSSARPR
jgi:dTDP-4-amino-4,6-dideoxygalactose transaminase